MPNLKRRRTRRGHPPVAIAAVLFGTACRNDAPDTGIESPGKSAIVVVLDGVRVDEFTSTATSDLTAMSGEDYASTTWATLAPDAAIARYGLNDAVTITAPAHGNLLTGTPVPIANLPVDAALGPNLYRPDIPTIFEEARAQLDLSADDVGLFGNTELLDGFGYSTWPGYGEAYGAAYTELFDEGKPDAPAGDDAPIFTEFSDRIKAGGRLLVANCHDVDRAGHYGSGDAYIDGVKKLDGLVANFWTWLRDSEPRYTEDLLLIVVADHGRHDHDLDNGWHNHGDACIGCREVPLFVLGGGANAGTVSSGGDFLTSDLAPTLAAHLGVDLPWAEGLPLSALFSGSEMPARSGVRDLAVSGSLRAEADFQAEVSARSVVVVDGEQLSTVGALKAEAPVVLHGSTADYACFRELVIDEAAATWPWVPRCFVRTGGGGWTDIGFPDEEVDPFWQPALVEEDGALAVSWARNPDFIGELGATSDVGVYDATWTAADGWTTVASTVTYVPTDVARAADWVAYGNDSGGDGARYARRIAVQEVGKSTFTVDVGTALGDTVREERPALRASGNLVDVGFLATGGDGWHIYTAHGEGSTWADPVELPTAGAVGNLSPAWDGDRLVWAQVVDDEAFLCRAAPGDADADCVDLGSPRVRAFEVTGGAGSAIVDEGIGQWAETPVAW